jgi:type I restriction enzyme S subunit
VVGLTKYLETLVDYRGKTPTKTDDGILLVTARNIKSGYIDYQASEEFISEHEYNEVMRRGFPAHGDVLFTTEASLGQVANVDKTNIALAQRIIKFRGQSDILNNYFLKYWILGDYCQADLEQLATGSTALGIKGSKVGQVRLCLPPHSEQVKLVAYLDQQTAQLDTLKITAQNGIELLKERRSALISAAVTGKIDVRGLVNTEAA